jgi:hypothetical protein
MSTHGHAAFAAADVEDARRGRPATDLSAYAQRRGLTVRGQELLDAFAGVQPAWPDYTFNVLSGELAPGLLGLVEHELEEVEVDADGLAMPGAFHGARYTGRRSSLLGLLVPFVDLNKKVPDAPFAASAAWVPTTRVALRVPEAALLPRLVARSAERFPMAGNPTLAEEGLSGLRLAGGNHVDPALRRAVFAGAPARALGGLDAAYVAVTICDGLVTVQRNGFVDDAGRLDALVDAAMAVATAAAAAGRDCSTLPPHVGPTRDQADAFSRAAVELGLDDEDPVALHHAVPQLPVPGVAVGCLHGRASGWSSPGRLAWFTRRGAAPGALRGAAVFPARPGARTPLGGTPVEGTDLIAEVCGDVAACWRREPAVGRLESRPLTQLAAEAMRRLQLADV